jgi:hypothetical protein
MPMSRFLPLLLALLPCVAFADFEAEPELEAAALVAPALLSGPGWQVAPRARVVGYQARFVLRTDHGEIEAESVEMLALRIAELPAVEALHESTASRVFLDSAKVSLSRRGEALAQIARRPVRTVTALPSGVARYFGDRVRKLGERARKLGDRIGRRVYEDGDPYDGTNGPISASRTAPSRPRRWHDKPRRELVNLAKGELDYGRARRAWAQRLGIDPQTSNPLIVPRLDRLAWVATGGDQAGDWMLGAVDGLAAEAIAAGGRVHAAVWHLEPEALRARNRARISRWCRDEDLLRRFLQHKAFNAALQTALVESTRALAPKSGCDALLETALMAATEQEARFVVNSLRLVEHHLGHQARGGELQPIGASLAFVARDGELILPLAVDHLAWTAQMKSFFDRHPHRRERRTLLVTGAISMRAQRELTERGWSLVPHLPYPDAPPYAASPRIAG